MNEKSNGEKFSNKLSVLNLLPLSYVNTTTTSSLQKNSLVSPIREFISKPSNTAVI